MQVTAFIQLHRTINGIETLLYGACMTAFLRPFMEERGEAGRSIRKKSLLVFFLYAAVFLPSLLLPGSGRLYMLADIAALIACSRFLGIERKLLFLLSILFFCMKYLSLMATCSLDFFTSRLFLARANTPEKVFRNALWNFILIDALMLSLFALMLQGLVRQLKKQAFSLHIRELCYLLLTPVTGIVFVSLLIWLLVVPDEDSVFQLYESVPATIYVIPLLAALFYAGTLAAIAVYERLVALQEERSRYFVEQHQLTAMRDRLTQVEQFYDEVRRAKHEMRGHLANIKSLAGNALYEDVERYIASMDASFQTLGPILSTGNAVTDVIISDKQRTAARLGIDFQEAFVYPRPGGYDAYDIGIILSNLLQNALEACERTECGERHIFLSGRQKKRFFLMEVRNSFDGHLRFDRLTNLPVSAKGPGRGSSPLHGIGLSNVKRTAEKYQGSVDIRTAGDEFIVTVLLQERNTGKPAEASVEKPGEEIW